MEDDAADEDFDLAAEVGVGGGLLFISVWQGAAEVGDRVAGFFLLFASVWQRGGGS